MSLRNRPFLLARISNESWVFFTDNYGILTSLYWTRPTGFYLLTPKRRFEQRFLLRLVNAGANWPFLLQNYIWPCPKGKDHNPLVTLTYIHLKSPYPHLFAKAKDLIPKNVNSK